MAPSSILDLPAETHLSIASYCSKEDIFSLIHISRALYIHCRDELYREVDLSCDKDPRYVEMLDRVHKNGMSMGEVEPFFYDHVMYSPRYKQMRFLHTLSKQPYLAEKVQSLKWTMLGPQKEYGHDQDYKTDYLGFPGSQMWEILSSMTNVTTVEMSHACALDVTFTLTGIPKNLRLCPRVPGSILEVDQSGAEYRTLAET